MRKKLSAALASFIPLLYLAAALALMAVLATNGISPTGRDALYHLYRSDTVYRSIQQGVWFPYYDIMWFNGTELLRFASPMCTYLLVLCQALSSGSVLNGYLLFVGIIFYAGALVWYAIGLAMERPFLGSLFGFLWFFLPYHIHTLMVQGNLSQSLALVFVPLVFYGTFRWLYQGGRRYVLLIAFSIFCITLADFAVAGMTALAVAVLFSCCSAFKAGRRFLLPLGAMVAGFLLAGVWLVPYVRGGLMSQEWTAQMEASFQPLRTTLDVAGHITGDSRLPYFGVSLLVTLLLCGIFSRRESAVPAWTAVLLLLFTTTVAFVIFTVVPAGQYLRMVLVFPAAAALCCFALLLWKNPRRIVVAALCVLLLADAGFSARVFWSETAERANASDRMDVASRAMLMEKAQQITTNRLAILDEGNMDSTGVFLATGWGDPVPVSGGDFRIYASPRDRMNRISRALTDGNYLYVADRCLEMGCDTIVLQTGILPPKAVVDERFDKAAAVLGYYLVTDGGSVRLYHSDLGRGWGVTSQYSAIGIGENAHYIAMLFPSFYEAEDPVLDHYTFEDLSRYEVVYLAGFTYTNLTAAEDLVRQLSDAGVRVVIEADGIPENIENRSRSFLGVVCNTIEFTNGYPELETVYGPLEPGLFPQGYTKWYTYYVNGLDEVMGVVKEEGFDLPFYGTVYNDNICLIGLDLRRYCTFTGDKAVKELLSTTLQISDQWLPTRQTVPVGVTYTGDGFTVTTEADNVNTTLAWHDFFRSESALASDKGLLFVDSGETQIRFRYPYMERGLAAVGVGLLGLALLFWRAGKQPIPWRRTFKPAEPSDSEKEGRS